MGKLIDLSERFKPLANTVAESMDKAREMQSGPVGEVISVGFTSDPVTFDDLEVPLNEVPTTRQSDAATWTNECPKCRGRGKFISRAGRIVGDCFMCKGSGRLTFKTSPHERLKAKAQRVERKARVATEKKEAFATEHAAEWAWMQKASARGFNYASDMMVAVQKFGSLTDNQMTAVRNCMERDATREAQWATERAEKDAKIATLDVKRIAEIFGNARAAGKRQPTLLVENMILSLAKEHSKNPGAIYVTREPDEYLGKIVDGVYQPTRRATPEDIDTLGRINADPLGLAIAYGKRTQRCSCCGKTLTNPLSVELGIGPICRDKWGM